MKWDFNDTDGSGKKYPTFEKGKRYDLVVVSSEDKESKEKRTPYLHLKFETNNLEPAHDKKLWNTPAAAWRAKEWMRAFGFKGDGDEDVPAEKLVGARFSAECDMVPGYDETDSKRYVEWINPLPHKIGDPTGSAQAERAPAKSAPAAKPEPAVNNDIEEVPF